MQNELAEIMNLIDRQIGEIDLNGDPPELYEPIQYILDLGGKRLRPALTVMAYSLFKENQSAAVIPAVAVELFHNFTLMHDDIMDQAPLRRGNPTVHQKWDDNVAILSGDVMLLKVYQLLLNTEPSKLYTVMKSFNQCAIEVCEGQQRDINFEQCDKVTESEYLEMIRQKTAVLLGFCLELGAILGDSDPISREHLKKFGINMGLGFQLKDDLLDVYGDQAKFGKQLGGDIISNKKTFLLVKALEQSTGQLHDRLVEWLQKTDFDRREKVEEVTRIYNDLNILPLTENRVNFYFDSAIDFLDLVEIEASKKEKLKLFAKKLMNREN